MVSLTCTTDRRDGVTLVTARLEGSGVAQRVRLANRLDGPVWPPRRQGVPEAGWDEDRFETVVSAGATVAVGYASPAPPTDAPLAVVDRETVDDGEREEPVSPSDALRDLGDPSPPRDAVPIPIGDPPTDDSPADDSPDASARANHAPVERLDSPASREPDQSPGKHDGGEVPAAVEAWLGDVEERVAMAERLAAAGTLPEATAALREAGGLAEAETLVETLRHDAAALESVARRTEGLAERTAAADVPLSTFERLA